MFVLFGGFWGWVFFVVIMTLVGPSAAEKEEQRVLKQMARERMESKTKRS